MDCVKCPTCGQVIMSIKKVEGLLRKTSSKVLLRHCLCGEAFEIRSLKRNAFAVSTSSGKRLEQFIEDVEGTS